MNKHRAFSTTVVACCTVMALSCIAAEEAAVPTRPPNVLFILVDDLGWTDLGCFGSKAYDTPSVDNLSKQGVTFTNFYSGGPVCSPTRSSIMTGKCTARTGITTYLKVPRHDPKYVTHALPLEEYTIGEAFRDGGYETGYFGKWHLGYSQKHWVANQGFNTAIGGIDLPWAWKECYPDKKMPPCDRRKDKHTRFFSPHHFTHMKDGPKGEYLTDRLTNETIKFMKTNKNKPFFAFLSFHTVHTPLEAKPEVVARYTKKFKEMGILGKSGHQRNGSRAFPSLPQYAAMVYHMDENVGRLMAFLQESGLEKNTIVVYTSDNGGKGSVTALAPLRGCKHNLYEGGIRVPTIIRMPDKRVPAREETTPLISDDFYPTLLELCSLKAQPQQHLDGRSFAALLQTERDDLPERPLFWHYPHSMFHGAVRLGDYKLMHNYKKKTYELYYLKNDIGESKNLIKEKPELALKLKTLHREWRERVGARFPKGMAVD